MRKVKLVPMQDGSVRMIAQMVSQYGTVLCPFSPGEPHCGLWCPKFDFVQIDLYSKLLPNERKSHCLAIQNCGGVETRLEVEPWE
jgi:hypothetical protein